MVHVLPPWRNDQAARVLALQCWSLCLRDLGKQVILSQDSGSAARSGLRLRARDESGGAAAFVGSREAGAMIVGKPPQQTGQSMRNAGEYGVRERLLRGQAESG